MQQTLQDKGHYRGKADGVFGLRTRASIRAYQKAENLPVTGQLDNETAGKLGVTPEVREEIGYETTHGKPSAGMRWAEGSRGTGKTLRKQSRDLPLVKAAVKDDLAFPVNYCQDRCLL